MNEAVLGKRASGILMPVRSLPSRWGIGDLGPEAYRFADFLAGAKQSFWQVLPVLSYPQMSVSPYSSVSAYAGNILLISPDLLMQDGFLSEEDMPQTRFPASRIDYGRVSSLKKSLFQKAHRRFLSRQIRRNDYDAFCSEHAGWLEEFSLFVALHEHFGHKSWDRWPKEARDRDGKSLEELKIRLEGHILYSKFLQFIFFDQWGRLKKSVNEKGVRIFGDIPIYVDYDSADVWQSQELFKLKNEDKTPLGLSGAPPDYFSATGQLWGNPVYRWDVIKEKGYDFWLRRIGHNLRLYDVLRIDHFRGFVAFWEVQAGEKTAINGKWVSAPAEDFLFHLQEKYASLPIVAEDLGHITSDVRDIMKKFQIPGMTVLQFAFRDHAGNPYLPHMHVPGSIVYTGTHDNNTVKGWYRREAAEEEKKRVSAYIGKKLKESAIHKDFVQMAMMSVARICMLPAQDILGLSEKARMNVPSTIKGNWTWRLLKESLSEEVSAWLADMTERYGRG